VPARGNKTVDGTVTWMEVTGMAAVNGDSTNTLSWSTFRGGGSPNPSLGVVIKRNNGASYQICTTAGLSVSASEPAFSDTAGVTTVDNNVTWTSLGPVTNFTGGQAPHARLPNAATVNWFAPGNTIYVGDNHAESQATAITIAPSVSATTIGKIVCHNHSGSYPPASGDLRTTATVSTTAAVNLTFNPSNGAVYVYGITFLAGVGTSSGTSAIILTPINAYYFFDNCVLKISNTSGTSTIQLNTTAAGAIIWNNCTVGFGAVGQFIDVGTAIFTWQNTGQVLASGSTVPTVLLGTSTSSRLVSTILEALDLSQITSTLIGTTSIVAMGNTVIKDCKLNASTAIVQSGNFGQTIQIVRSDSSGTGYKSARYQYEGTETTETSITRVGGASDPTGQAQSRKIVTTANSQWLRPFKAEPYAIWNPRTAANVTVTVCGTINAGALPNNDDIWLEVEYLGSATFPIGTIVITTKANVLATGSAVASDGSTWNGGGSGVGWSPFKLTTTLSSPQPGMAGYLHARVRAAKPSTTFYIDPQITLS
jgi:hypothetical protein